MNSDTLLQRFTPEEQNAIQAEIERLTGADSDALEALNTDSEARRVRWFHENRTGFDFLSDDLLISAYLLLVRRFGVTPEEMPIVSRSENEIVFYSMNFCPTLEACKILGLDTRYVCKCINERSTDLLLKQLDPRLTFSRNYKNLRPYAAYCEEMISLHDNGQNP